MKNCFDRTPHTMKDWLLLAAGVAAVFAAADWLPGVLRGAGAFLGLLAPFGWGLLLAYVLDIPTRFFAQKLFGGRRGGAMAVSYALFFGALALLAALIVPQLVQSVTTFAGRLGAYEETIRGLLVWVQNTFGIDTATAEQLVQMVGTALQNWFGGLSRSAARAAADFVSGAAGAAGNAVVALAASIYLLSGKEALLHISEIDWKRFETMEESGLKEGEMIDVKLIGVDEKTGKLKLSHRALLPKPEGYVERERRPRGDRERRRDDRHRD